MSIFHALLTLSLTLISTNRSNYANLIVINETPLCQTRKNNDAIEGKSSSLLARWHIQDPCRYQPCFNYFYFSLEHNYSNIDGRVKFGTLRQI
jgi:hypothetical protein